MVGATVMSERVGDRMRPLATRMARDLGSISSLPRRVVLLGTSALLGATALAGCGSGSGSGRTSAPAGVTACDATSVAAKQLPAVVTIRVSGPNGVSTGSGEIIREDGAILTNNHVVSPAVSGGSVSVVLSDGRSFPATITGRDVQTDLAVIRIDAGKPLTPISIGSSHAVRVGQPVVVLGAPLGLSNTVTTGIVSALDRTVQVPADNGQTATLLAAIQTDAAINPGNSGGALTDCAGALIGVPTANATVTTATGESSLGNVGINFAIPVDLAIGVADEILATGTVTHSYMGIAVQAVPSGAGGSAYLSVVSVVPGGPAAAAGLQSGDVITSIDGEPASDPLQLALLTIKKKPGETVALTYERGGQSMQATLTLGAVP
jgi:putative serine protease PepD